jgi:putative acetyltransferase
MPINLIYAERYTQTIEHLTDIWEASVRATHDFLNEGDIQEIKPMVELGLTSIDSLIIAQDETEKPVGFMGVASSKIEMLFIHPDARGKGIGKMLINLAIQELGATYVDVNEQNPQAIGFYEKLGFETFERSPLDDQGRPFPILHMRLNH